MSLRNLPEAKTFNRPKNFHWEAPSDVLARWADGPMAAEQSADNVISIFDVIGEDFWSGGGFTAKRMASALRSIGERDVRVQINSPGGDMFEGIASYNMLRAHKGKVTIEVMGWAASAASIIAMAGDEIRMGLGTFMMVHNAWGMVIGNQHDQRAAADLFEGFDSALADIYEARTSAKRADIVKLMDAETFMSPSDAMKNGFADALDEGITMPDDTKNSVSPEIRARRRMDALLAQQGIPRSERRSLMREAGGSMRDAAPTITRDADLDPAAILQLINEIRS